jgi:hypothetical protein
MPAADAERLAPAAPRGSLIPAEVPLIDAEILFKEFETTARGGRSIGVGCVGRAWPGGYTLDTSRHSAPLGAGRLKRIQRGVFRAVPRLGEGVFVF